MLRLQPVPGGLLLQTSGEHRPVGPDRNLGPPSLPGPSLACPLPALVFGLFSLRSQRVPDPQVENRT